MPAPRYKAHPRHRAQDDGVLTPVPGPTDEELLAGADPAAFEAFYRRHAETVLGALARRSGDPALAAELTAETFAVALRERRRRPPGTPADWLLGSRRPSGPRRSGAAARAGGPAAGWASPRSS